MQHKNLAVIWGSKLDTFTAAGDAIPGEQTGQSFSRSADMVEHKDGNGETKGLTFFNPSDEMTIRCYPSADTLANAKAANVLPAIGARIVIGFTGSPSYEDAQIAGNYVCTACSKERNQGDKTTFDITVKRWSVHDVTNNISA